MDIVRYADNRIYGVNNYDELFTRVEEFVDEKRNDAYHEKVKLKYILQLIKDLFNSNYGFISVASNVERLALVYDAVIENIIIKEGLIILQENTQELYILVGNNPALESNWKLLTSLFNDVGIIPIRSLADLPAPVNNEIILTTTGKLYFFVNEIDFQDTIFYPKNNSFIGVSQNNGAIYNAQEVIVDSDTTFRSMKFRSTSIRITNALQSYDWQFINFQDCSKSIIIANADNLILETVGFLNSAGVVLEGTINSLILAPNCFFSFYTLTVGAVYVDISNTAIINRRLRIENSVMIVSPNTIGLKIHPLATVPTESIILNTVSFSGAGTYLDGVNGNSDIAKFTNCSGTGIINSSSIGGLILRNNLTATTALVQGIQKQIAGNFTGSVLDQRFNVISGVSYYTSSVTRTFKIICSFTLTSNNNTVVGTYIAKVSSGNVINPSVDVIPESEMYLTANGTRPDTGTIITFITLSQGDGWYIVTENDSATNDITYRYVHALIETTN